MSVAHWRTLLLQLGEVPGEGADARVNRQTLVLGGVLMSGGGLLWGGLALAFGRVTESSIPLGYVVLTLLNLGLLARDRRFPRARNVQVLISLLLPFMFQWSLGGFVDSGGVMLWAMIALVGSLTLSSTRQAVVWLSLYCALTVLSGVFDAELAARAGVDVPAWVQRLFFVINIVTISSIVFTLGIAITQRQRRAIVALEAGQEANRALYERLQETVSSRELDIERLRAAESALTAGARGVADLHQAGPRAAARARGAADGAAGGQQGHGGDEPEAAHPLDPLAQALGLGRVLAVVGAQAREVTYGGARGRSRAVGAGGPRERRADLRAGAVFGGAAGRDRGAGQGLQRAEGGAARRARVGGPQGAAVHDSHGLVVGRPAHAV